jgi:acetolactate synthase-1/2/3 large subunit
VVILNNRAYRILDVELARIDVQRAGPRAKALLNLGDPDLDFVKLGTGLGVESRRVDTAEELTGALERAIVDSGPHLLEVVIPTISTRA